MGKGAWCTLLGLFAVCAFVSTADAKSQYFNGSIARDVDGDTVWFKTAGKGKSPFELTGEQTPNGSQTPNVPLDTLKIRMIGIDAPESHLPTPDHGVVGQGDFGTQAATVLADMLPVGTKATLEDSGKDKYGRTLGKIFTNSNDVNLAMVEAGWAITYIICEGENCTPQFFKDQRVEEYVNACKRAQANGLGVWNPKQPLTEMPFEFRLRMQGRRPDKYVGSFEDKTLYSPKDYRQVDVCERIFFKSPSDAKAVGFTAEKKMGFLLNQFDPQLD